MAKEIYLYSGIYGFVAEAFNKSLEELQGEDVDFRVSSGGGDVLSGWPMIVKMGEHNGNIKIKVDGMAASMALFMLPYANEVEAIEVARFMIHRADGYAPSDSDKQHLEAVNASLRKQFEKRIDSNIFKEVTGKTIKEIFTAEKRIDVWLTAKEAKKVGLVTKVTKLEPRLKAEAETMINAIAATAGFVENKKPKAKKEEKKSNNYKQKTQIMNIAQLKAEHPAIYASVIAEGETQERDRVGAFMAFAEVDLKAVKEGIESGKPLTATLTAEFSVKMIQAGAVKNLEEGSEEELDTKGEGKGNVKDEKTLKAEAKEKEEFEAKEKELYAELGIEAPKA